MAKKHRKEHKKPPKKDTHYANGFLSPIQFSGPYMNTGDVNMDNGVAGSDTTTGAY